VVQLPADGEAIWLLCGRDLIIFRAELSFLSPLHTIVRPGRLGAEMHRAEGHRREKRADDANAALSAAPVSSSGLAQLCLRCWSGLRGAPTGDDRDWRWGPSGIADRPTAAETRA